MNAKIVASFIIGTLFGWVILYILVSLLGLTIAALFSMWWFIIPLLLILLIIWLIYRVIVGNIWYSKDKHNKN